MLSRRCDRHFWRRHGRRALLRRRQQRAVTQIQCSKSEALGPMRCVRAEPRCQRPVSSSRISWIPGAIRRRPAAALRRLERVVSSTIRSEAFAVLAEPRRQSSSRTPLASSSPCLASSLSQSFCERRSRKRASNMSDASFLPHGRSPSLRQHRRRREESLCLGACGTPVSKMFNTSTIAI